MGVRLYQALKEFNQGLQTVVDFLEKKGFKVEADLNVKLSDEAYQAIKDFYGKDKQLRNFADEFINKRQEDKEKEKKKAPPKVVEEIKTEIPKEAIPQIKSLGQIDLDEKKP